MKSSDAKDGDGAATRKRDVCIVGIGSSAGGIGALEALLPTLRPNAGLAYVVVQHLHPQYESALAAVLGRVTRMPVVEATKGLAVEPDHVYTIPRDTTLTVVGNRLQVVPGEKTQTLRAPIDAFFSSLATARGEDAACVILSGTGSDGTIGMRAVKDEGGLTIAQAHAEYDGMMRSALNAGLVDFVLPVEKIAAKLYDYFDHLDQIGGRKGLDGVRPEAANHLQQIIALLRTRTGHDFSGYKDKTVVRRVQRRMQVLQIGEVPDYLARVRRQPEELDALLQDLLIGVTKFFRDPQSFEVLARDIIPRLFDTARDKDSIRVWVPGCSTGEEAYSVAMLLREHAPRDRARPKLQVFATDIDEASLQFARIGRYPATIMADVSPERLDRFFLREDSIYRVTADLREMCLFSSHNVLRDPPFSKLDLLCCRNLLIYFEQQLQNRLMPLFHYALNDGGYLFLGSSENVSRHSRLFAPIDKTHRIFQRRQAARHLPDFPLGHGDRAARRGATAPPPAEEESLQAVADRQILERFSPAFVVINAEGDVLHGSARTGKYLELGPGVPRLDIFSMAKPGLRIDLRAVIDKATKSGQPATQKNITVGTNGGSQTFDLVVQPFKLRGGAAETLYLVVFQDVGGIRADGEQPRAEIAPRQDTGVGHIEAELQTTRERLQTMTEELESSNEELRSGYEELSSMNEELQSTNEELETSKEELQSINEELQTVNAELNVRVEELSRANSDIANLLESTQIATVFLDRALAIKNFTPAAKDLFRLVESDIGRPLAHVMARFDTGGLQEDAERVLRTLGAVERKIESNYSDARYIMRMVPYRTVDNVIAGVVITFVDVTRITAAEARIGELSADLAERVQSLEALLDLLPVGILIMADNLGGEVLVNRAAARLVGQGIRPDASAPQPLAAELRIFLDGRELPPAEQPLYRASRKGEIVAEFEGTLVRADGSRQPVLMSATPLLDEHGKARGGIAVLVDIAERKAADEHQQLLLHELQHRVKNIISTIGALATRTLSAATSYKQFSDAFLGRLQAMSLTHELLSRDKWQGTDLADMLASVLGAHGGSGGANLDLDGPGLTLAPNAASTLGMVFYELATNAAKHGALSQPAGRIAVAWRVEKDMVVLEWKERGRPAGRRDKLDGGFGVGFIRSSVEYELSGEATLELQATGLRCRLIFPLERNVQDARAD